MPLAPAPAPQTWRAPLPPVLLPRPSVGRSPTQLVGARAPVQAPNVSAVGSSSGLPGFFGPVGRTNGRLGFDVYPDADAARRTVPSPEGVSINRMPVLAHPAINIPEHDQTHVDALAKQVKGLFNKEGSF